MGRVNCGRVPDAASDLLVIARSPVAWGTEGWQSEFWKSAVSEEENRPCHGAVDGECFELLWAENVPLAASLE